MSRGHQHIARLELCLKLIDDDALEPTDAEDLKDRVEDVPSARNQDDFDEPPTRQELYADMNLDERGGKAAEAEKPGGPRATGHERRPRGERHREPPTPRHARDARRAPPGAAPKKTRGRRTADAMARTASRKAVRLLRPWAAAAHAEPPRGRRPRRRGGAGGRGERRRTARRGARRSAAAAPP